MQACFLLCFQKKSIFSCLMFPYSLTLNAWQKFLINCFFHSLLFHFCLCFFIFMTVFVRFVVITIMIVISSTIKRIFQLFKANIFNFKRSCCIIPYWVSSLLFFILILNIFHLLFLNQTKSTNKHNSNKKY